MRFAIIDTNNLPICNNSIHHGRPPPPGATSCVALCSGDGIIELYIGFYAPFNMIREAALLSLGSRFGTGGHSWQQEDAVMLMMVLSTPPAMDELNNIKCNNI